MHTLHCHNIMAVCATCKAPLLFSSFCTRWECCERRQAEVSALTTAEQERMTKAIQLGQGHSQEALALIAQQGPAVRARLVQLTQLVLQLLNGFVMPGDLVGSAQDLQEAVMHTQDGESVSMTVDASTPHGSR